jgi:iron complex transport system permease protein
MTGRPPAPSPIVWAYPLVVVVAAGLLVLLLAAHLGVGTVRLTPAEIAAALTDRSAPVVHRQIVWELRLPRALIAVTAGAMLSLSGALLQSVLRNPIAAPNLTGVTAGAIVAIVAWLAVSSGGAATAWASPLFALGGGVAAGAATYWLSRRHGRTDPMTLALTGVLLSAILTSVTTIVLVVHPPLLGGIFMWLIGGLTGRVWRHWSLLWPWALVTVPAALASARPANLLQLGDGMAAGLGLGVERTRLLLLFLAVALAAGAAAAVGAIGFVGLIGPHIARAITGNDARRLFPLVAVCGASLLVGADAIAQALVFDLPWRTLSPAAQLPAGVLMALLGAPFFLTLIRRPR